MYRPFFINGEMKSKVAACYIILAELQPERTFGTVEETKTKTREERTLGCSGGGHEAS